MVVSCKSQKVINRNGESIYFMPFTFYLTFGVYEVHVQSSLSGNSGQFGSWNAVTGSSHSVGAGKNLLGSVGISW
jgi:hypothetical protein